MSGYASSAACASPSRRWTGSWPGNTRRWPSPASGPSRAGPCTARSPSPGPAGHPPGPDAFLGPRPAAELQQILGALRDAAARAEPPRLAVRGYRETRSVGMLTCDDEDGHAAALATDLQQRLQALGVYEPKRRRWLPHVTVVRFRKRPRLRPALPALEPFAPSDAAAFLSRLRPDGARYEVLESVEVGGR